MSEETIQVELSILGRTFGLTCAPSLEKILVQAAEKLDADLRADLGEGQISAKTMLDHLVAVTLEYLCDDIVGAASQERQAMIRRIEDATSKLHEIDNALSNQ
ncbi:MAG: cell division protein ZapA [Gammaproteobacteria bacterium]|nr:cell division protein ZapA [Gammaproteobacteria bacterium]